MLFPVMGAYYRLILAALLVALASGSKDERDVIASYGDGTLVEPPQVNITFHPEINQTIILAMNEPTQVRFSIKFDEGVFVGHDSKTTDSKALVALKFTLRTITPHFDIIRFDAREVQTAMRFNVSTKHIAAKNYTFNSHINLKTDFIGRAKLEMKAKLISHNGAQDLTVSVLNPGDMWSTSVDIEVVNPRDRLDELFVLANLVLLFLYFVELASQLQNLYLDEILRKAFFFWSMICMTILPFFWWTVANWFSPDNPTYKLSAYVYLLSSVSSLFVKPVAAAYESRSLGLTITSAYVALLTVPVMLIALDRLADSSGHYTIKINYWIVSGLMFLIVFATLLGRTMEKTHRHISRKLNTTAKLASLITFMFDYIDCWQYIFNWRIVAVVLGISLSNYLLGALLALLVPFPCKSNKCVRMILIAQGMAYRDPSLMFMALLAFPHPENVILCGTVLTFYIANAVLSLFLSTLTYLKGDTRFYTLK